MLLGTSKRCCLRATVDCSGSRDVERALTRHGTQASSQRQREGGGATCKGLLCSRSFCEPSGAAKANAMPGCLQPPPVTGTGKFHFKNGATYEGEWMQAPPAPGEEPAPAAPPAKPDPKADPKAMAAAAEATAAAALESMQRVRHGRGQLGLDAQHLGHISATT